MKGLGQEKKFQNGRAGENQTAFALHMISLNMISSSNFRDIIAQMKCNISFSTVKF